MLPGSSRSLRPRDKKVDYNLSKKRAAEPDSVSSSEKTGTTQKPKRGRKPEAEEENPNRVRELTEPRKKKITGFLENMPHKKGGKVKGLKWIQLLIKWLKEPKKTAPIVKDVRRWLKEDEDWFSKTSVEILNRMPPPPPTLADIEAAQAAGQDVVLTDTDAETEPETANDADDDTSDDSSGKENRKPKEPVGGKTGWHAVPAEDAGPSDDDDDDSSDDGGNGKPTNWSNVKVPNGFQWKGPTGEGGSSQIPGMFCLGNLSLRVGVQEVSEELKRELLQWEESSETESSVGSVVSEPRAQFPSMGSSTDSDSSGGGPSGGGMMGVSKKPGGFKAGNVGGASPKPGGSRAVEGASPGPGSNAVEPENEARMEPEEVIDASNGFNAAVVQLARQSAYAGIENISNRLCEEARAMSAALRRQIASRSAPLPENAEASAEPIPVVGVVEPANDVVPLEASISAPILVATPAAPMLEASNSASARVLEPARSGQSGERGTYAARLRPVQLAPSLAEVPTGPAYEVVDHARGPLHVRIVPVRVPAPVITGSSSGNHAGAFRPGIIRGVPVPRNENNDPGHYVRHLALLTREISALAEERLNDENPPINWRAVSTLGRVLQSTYRGKL